jgi:hypothetical protein
MSASGCLFFSPQLRSVVAMIRVIFCVESTCPLSPRRCVSPGLFLISNHGKDPLASNRCFVYSFNGGYRKWSSLTFSEIELAQYLVAPLDRILWAAGFVGHLALLTVLVTRRRVRDFPVFASFIAFATIRTVVLFLIMRHGSVHAYKLGYWIFSPGDYAFQIAIIFEMARNVLRPTGTWVQDARTAFLLWSAVGTMIAFGLSLAIAPPEAKGLDLWTARATVFTSLLTCATFLAMSSAANRLGLLWRSHVMALGQGLTAWALFALFGNLVHLAGGWRHGFVYLDHTRMFVYLGVLLFWIGAFWSPERKRAPLSRDMQNYLLALHQRVLDDLEAVKFEGNRR